MKSSKTKSTALSNPPPIVALAQTITKLQAERKTAQARYAVVLAEKQKLENTLHSCDAAQAKAQREMDRLAAEPLP